jgi:isoquinoline 1-oxidoreductase beta subunit
MTHMVSRRFVLTASAAVGGGLMVGIGMPTAANAATASTVNVWVTIGTDETVTILSSGAEMGQGVLSSMPQLIAEELLVDWAKVKTAPAPSGSQYLNPVTHSQGTGGSNNMRSWFRPLLLIGAATRMMLVSAAAQTWKISEANCQAVIGGVVNTATNAKLTYGALASLAATLPVPATPTLLSASNGYRLVGKSVMRPDIPAKTTGAAKFGIDIRIPGMVYAAIKHAPVFGATVASVGAAPNGAKAVSVGNAVVVTGANTWAAFQNARNTSVKWTTPAGNATATSASINAQAAALLKNGPANQAESIGDIKAGMAAATKTINATYTLPYLAHACMEVLNCTASVTATRCEVWAPSQGADSNLRTAIAATGLAASQITIHPTLLGGGLGRKFEQDYVSQAILASKTLGVPVHLTWSREDDFSNDFYRPMALCNVTAGIDAAGNITAWNNRIISPSVMMRMFPAYVKNGIDGVAIAGATALPYKMGARFVDYSHVATPVPVGFWRSVGESVNNFVLESAIDELAAAAGQDPYAYRVAQLTDPRALAVLKAAAAMINWTTKPAAGHARGIAVSVGFGSYIAQAIEIASATATTVTVVRVCAAVDCGPQVNPDTIIAQIQSGVVHGLSSALWGNVPISGGAAQTRNFNNYALTRMGNMPRVDVQIISNPSGPVGGIGEVGVPPVAPALANAYFALTGKRLRTLPLQIVTPIYGED